MDDTIVVVRFTDLGLARRALAQLKQLDHERRIRVSGAALLQRAREGGVEASPDEEGYFLPQGGSIGMLVDALSGPVGVLYAEPTEAFRGHGHHAHEDEWPIVLDDIMDSLTPGTTLVIAEIEDPDPAVLDPALAELGGRVTRRPAKDVFAEVDAAQDAVANTSTKEQAKERWERFKEAVKNRRP